MQAHVLHPSEGLGNSCFHQDQGVFVEKMVHGAVRQFRSWRKCDSHFNLMLRFPCQKSFPKHPVSDTMLPSPAGDAFLTHSALALRLPGN